MSTRCACPSIGHAWAREARQPIFSAVRWKFRGGEYKWPLIALLLALGPRPCSAQSRDLRVNARIGRLSYGHGDVVRESAKDKGNLFDGLDLGAALTVTGLFVDHWYSGAGLGFSYARQSFQLPCNCPQPQDRVMILENDLQWGAVEAMGSFGYRTKNESYWYGQIGFGTSLPVLGKREVTYVIDFLDNRPDSSGTIESGNYELRAEKGLRVGFLWEAAFGHKFMSPALPIWLEAYYRADLTAWHYELEYFQPCPRPSRSSGLPSECALHGCLTGNMDHLNRSKSLEPGTRLKERLRPCLPAGRGAKLLRRSIEHRR